MAAGTCLGHHSVAVKRHYGHSDSNKRKYLIKMTHIHYRISVHYCLDRVSMVAFSGKSGAAEIAEIPKSCMKQEVD